MKSVPYSDYAGVQNKIAEGHETCIGDRLRVSVADGYATYEVIGLNEHMARIKWVETKDNPGHYRAPLIGKDAIWLPRTTVDRYVISTRTEDEIWGEPA